MRTPFRRARPQAERPALPLTVVHDEAAASARRRASGLLEATVIRPNEAQRLLSVIEAGAVEGAHIVAAGPLSG